MFGVGFTEILIVALVALLVLGPEKLPDLARQIGKGLRELRRTTNELQNTLQEAMYADDPNERLDQSLLHVRPAVGTQPRATLTAGAPDSVATVAALAPTPAVAAATASPAAAAAIAPPAVVSGSSAAPLPPAEPPR